VKRAGFSRFIKGELRTGKAILSFEILNEFWGNTVVYLSTRVSLPHARSSRNSLAEKNVRILLPWLVDATKLFISARAFP
jgi:hypothetical protein